VGIGDQLMAAGRAKLLNQETGRKVSIGRPDRIIWCELYDHNPYLVRPSDHLPEDEIVRLYDYPGARPYIDYQATLLHADNRYPMGLKNTVRWVWNFDYGPPEPAEIFLSDEEQWQAEEYMKHPYVIVDPHIKEKAPPHKKWPFPYFQDVVDEIEPYVQVIQPHHVYGDLLQGVKQKSTSLREIAVWMSKAVCVITNEGLLHHLAAAFNTPAVVIAGAFVPKDITGYEYQDWFTKADRRVLGVRVNCRAGHEVMMEIKPPEVITAVKRIMKKAGI